MNSKIVTHQLQLLKRIRLNPRKLAPIDCVLLGLLVTTIIFFIITLTTHKKILQEKVQQNNQISKQLALVKTDLENLKNTDQVKRNDALEDTIKKIQTTYDDSITVYESITDQPATNKDLPSYRKRFAQILKYLGDKNYSSGSAGLAKLKSDIDAANAASLAAASGIDTSHAIASNTAPGSGYSMQSVSANGTSYLVALIAGNLSNTRVIVDTASDSDCGNNCPTLPLGTYVARNGAYAGVNGSYFCPAEYPSCTSKTNSFDTLAMNVKKHYFNSDNNIYSTVPAVIFGGGFVRFVGASQDWGRDTGVDGVLANQPLLVSSGNVVFGGDGDPKKGSRGNRSFVANKGNTVYIGVAYNVTVAESALVMKALGMDNALNLDSGGSTALWASGGYKAGPGRNIPNAILFVNK